LPWRCAIRSQWGCEADLVDQAIATALAAGLRTADIKSEGMAVVGTAEKGTSVLQELDRLAA
jgi:3-isopropylmalate dehydrogenase